MASQQAIKHRKESVKNTKQITKAMQLVAASKLRKAQEAAIGPKDFVATAKELLASLAWHPDAMSNPLFTAPNTPNKLTIVVSSDRGLAGAYNTNVLKAFASTLQQTGGGTNYVISVGKYASRFVARLKNIESLGAYEQDMSGLDVDIVQPILKTMLKSFDEGNVSSVTVIYTRFISTIKQEVIIEPLLPINKSKVKVSDRTFEPNAEAVFEKAVTRILEAQMLQYMLEARASEQASRMIAMKNATDNASELIDDLTLMYNNARQAKITQELAEISAGAEAIK
jgi:F-type H+-transporting ATPase subunit gamma